VIGVIFCHDVAQIPFRFLKNLRLALGDFKIHPGSYFMTQERDWLFAFSGKPVKDLLRLTPLKSLMFIRDFRCSVRQEYLITCFISLKASPFLSKKSNPLNLGKNFGFQN